MAGSRCVMLGTCPRSTLSGGTGSRDTLPEFCQAAPPSSRRHLTQQRLGSLTNHLTRHTAHRHNAAMTRLFSTVTWGLALLLSAAVLAWQQSLPWTLATAGAVPVVVGLGKALWNGEAADNAKFAKAREESKVSPFLEGSG